MNTALLIAILVCSVGIIVYLLFMTIKHKQSKAPSDEDLELESNRLAISDNPIYRETKEIVNNLRVGLDQFQERIDSCFTTKVMGSREELRSALEQSFPKMYDALGESRNAANELLRFVEPAPDSDSSQKESTNLETLSAPPGELKTEEYKLTRVEGLVKRLQVIIDGVGPLIAHFYVALTLPDKKAQLKEAATHATSLVEHLDDSIRELKRIEKSILDLD